MNKRIIKEKDLVAIYPPIPDSFILETERMIACLPAQKEEAVMKRKVSSGLIFAIITILLLTGVAFAAVKYGVLDFLLEERGYRLPHNANQLTHPLQTQLSQGSVSFSVDSAFFDGERFAIDWNIENEQPENPVYVQIDEFTVNGVKVSGDDTDGFDDTWLPGLFSPTGHMQGGENIILPQFMGKEETLHVSLGIGIYTPIAPIYYMETFDAILAEEKRREGYFVLPEGDGFVINDPEEGILHCFGGIGRDWVVEDSEEDSTAQTGRSDHEYVEQYRRQELSLTFDVDATQALTLRRELTPETQYTCELFTASYTKAVYTPLGFYLEMDVVPLESTYENVCDLFDGRFQATDGEGNPLGSAWEGGMWAMQLEDDSWGLHVLCYEQPFEIDDLPEQVSLTYFSENESQTYIFPIPL